MKKNSKAIGGDYEREIAKKLSDWLQYEKPINERDLICWRVSHSGSVGTNLKKKGIKGQYTSGDFQCLNSNYEYFFNTFHCDSKSLGDVHLMFINPKNKKSNQVLNEWKKVFEDAGNNKIPIMFVKARNDRKIPEFIVLPKLIHVDSDLPCMFISLNNKYSFYIVLLEEFFQHEKPKHFYEKNKNFVVDKSSI